jgi:hypothetical protein
MLALTTSNIIALYLYSRNKLYDRWLASFIFVFSLVQLGEFFLWTSQRSNDGKPATITNFSYSNNTITRFIFLALMLQPLVQCYGAFLSYHDKNKIVKNILTVAVIFYIFLFLYSIWFSIRNGQNMHTSVGESGHLEWNNQYTPDTVTIFNKKVTVDPKPCSGLICGFVAVAYLIGIIAPLFIMGKKGIFLLVAGLIGICVSLYMARKSPASFGSMFCFFAIIYSMAGLLI